MYIVISWEMQFLISQERPYPLIHGVCESEASHRSFYRYSFHNSANLGNDILPKI